MEEKWRSIKIYELFSFVDSFVHAAACENESSRGDISMVIDRRIEKKGKKIEMFSCDDTLTSRERKNRFNLKRRKLPVENVSAIFTRVISGINVPAGRCWEQQRHRYHVLQFLSTWLQPADILIWQGMTCFDCKHRLYDAFVPRS